MTIRPDNRPLRVAGVDGCKAGWVVAVLSGAKSRRISHPLTIVNLWVLPHFADVLAQTSACRLVCVDIPIGLSDGPGPRACDRAARRLLGRRACSVFSPPVRACLNARDYETASRTHCKRTGKRLSKQSFFLIDKIRQVDELITPAMQSRVREIHPEVAFYVLSGHRPTKHNKKRVAGRRERIELLEPVFPDAEATVNKVRRTGAVEPDDILDALAAAWVAMKAATGQAAALPGLPERDGRELRMEILLPSDRT